jgi:hypothetical protein
VAALALLASCRFDVDRLTGDGPPFGRDGAGGSGDGASAVDGLLPNDGAVTADLAPAMDGAIPLWDGASCNGIGDTCDMTTPTCPGSLECHFSFAGGGACTTGGRPACDPSAPFCPPQAPTCLPDTASVTTGVCASDFEIWCICMGTGSGAFLCPL